MSELAALASHEAVPSCHNQIALPQEMALPDVRKYQMGFTAFVEGWSLSAEHLGLEIGVYDMPQRIPVGCPVACLARAMRLVPL